MVLAFGRALAVLGLAVGGVAPAWAGDAPVPAGRPAAAPAPVAEKSEDDEDARVLARGAELNRDFEADRLLRRVRELLETPQPQYRDVVVLLQTLIDRPGDAFASEDGSVFRPVRYVAERLLAGLGAAGLDAYRMEADGQAKALLGTVASCRDEEALRTVARQYFLSSHGDDAAYLLGCLHLDQLDFAKARRLFRRVLTEHPDPSVPRADVVLRLALACHRCGDAEGAQAAWRQLAAAGPTRLSPEALKAIEGEVAGNVHQAAAGPDTVRPTARGLFPPLPTSAIGMPRGLCIPAWQHAISMIPTDLPPTNFGQLKEADLNALKDRMLGRWENSALVPSGHALLMDGAMILKSQGTLTCLDTATGQQRWRAQAPAPKQGTNTRISVHHFSHLGQAHPLEVLQFDDQIGRAMRVVGDRVYHIEEYYENRWGPQRFGMQMFIRNNPRQAKQATGSVLAAYDARTGKVAWRIGRSLDDDDPVGAVQFVAAPVASGGRLLVPVERRGELWLTGLDPANGRCLWQTFLCSYVVPRMDSWRLVGLAVQGSDVYVASGQGFVFAVDGTDGSLHWASQYEQEWDKTTSSPFGQTSTLRGWRDGLVFIEGGKLIVLPSDAERVLVLDATSGKAVASHKTPGLDFCLGLDGTHLFAASATCVRRMDAVTGRKVWERKLEGTHRACGRGLLTPDALFVPSGQCILRLDPQKGSVQATLRVATEDDEPVGNLVCDGARLLVISPTRAYAVTDAAPKLAEAERRVADMDKQVAGLAQDAPPERRTQLLKSRAEAQVARAHLRLKYDRAAEAVEDLKAALHDSPDSKLKGEARHELVECLTLLAKRQPEQRLELLREAHTIARGSPDEGQTVLPLVEAHRQRGELEQALDMLLQFARADRGRTLDLSTEGDTWQASPVAVAAGGVQRLLGQEAAKLGPLLAHRGEAAMATARSSKDVAALQAILRLYPGTPAAVEAGLKAAAAEAATGIFEKAEVILREMARSGHRPTAAAGLAGLADLHQKKGWLSQARWEWATLAKEFADTPVPLDGKPKTGAALAAERLAAKALAEADEDMFKGVQEPPWRLAWKASQPPGQGYPVKLRQSPRLGVLEFSQFLEQHLLFQRHGQEMRLACRRVSDGQTLYDVQLGQPPNHVYLQAHQGARDGHIVLLQGNNILKGFGLVSGKPIWTRAEPAARATGIQFAVRWRMNIYQRASGGVPTGCVVQRPNPSTVRVLELATGDVRWERTFRRRQVAWAQEAGCYVLLSLEGGECWVCDAFSGDRLSTFEFEEGPRIGYPRSLQVTRHGALYQGWDPAKSRNRVSLLELPSGKTLWSADLGQAYRQPILLNEDLFYLAGMPGLELRDVATGEARFTLPQDKLPGNLNNVTLSADGKVLGFCTYDGQGKMRMNAVELATGRLIEGEGTGIQLFGGTDIAEAWARSGDLIPWMTMDPPVKQGNTMRHTNLRNIGFTRKSTGKILEGHGLPSPRPDGKFENVNQLFVQDGMLILMRHDGTQVFGHDPNPPKDAPKPPAKAAEPPKADKPPDGKGQGTEKK